MAPRVMILEDDPFIALDMEGLMEDAGFDVVGPVASGTEAMKLLDGRKAPDCALLDFHVTGGTTETVARELERRGVPYTFVTGNPHDVRRAFTHLRPTVLPKPVRARAIVRHVEAMLSDAA